MNFLKKSAIGLGIVLGISLTFSQNADKNLLSNPGFEDSLEFWKYDADFGEFGMSEISFDDPDAVHSGKKGAKLTVTEAGFYDWHVKLRIPWEWEAVKNQKYRLTFWAKSQAPSKKLPLNYSSGPPDKVDIDKKVFTLSPDWKQFEYEFTSQSEGSGAVYLTLMLGLDTGVFYLDEFVLNTVGEISIKVRIPLKNLHLLETDNSSHKIWDIKGRNVSAALFDRKQNRLPFFIFQKRKKYLPLIDFQQ